MSVALVLERPRNRWGSDHDQPESPRPRQPVPVRDSAPEAVPVAQRRGRVLVVDDHPGVRETLREILEQEGYEVTEASEGQEALFLLGRQSLDVVILDLAMPGHDGLWLLDRLGPAMPRVIVCSAFANLTEAEVQARAGSKVFRCLRKPVMPSVLLAAVADAICQDRP